MSKLAVCAFGGNALLLSNQKGTIYEQEDNATRAAKNLMPLIKKGYNLVLSHGNGPQVGNIMLRNHAGHQLYNIEEMPLDICVADSQGGIGYMIERILRNVLFENGYKKDVATLVTPVVIDENDPAFQNPTKPVGPYYSKEEAEKLAKENNWAIKEDARGRGWRRVVASPKPLDIFNVKLIEELARRGYIVIAAGGGGIPVYFDEKGFIRANEMAVIDKDLASSLMAQKIKADEFYILTDVPKVCINFNKPDQKELDLVTVAEAEKLIQEGHFAAGSMLPKVQAAIQFVKNTGNVAVITELGQLDNENAGTRFVP
ncbi:MAG TPA: carbamate kinase [Ignavibacteriales bacterium]|nr:carbamate kinase [Ignavibacteriales bacterium]HPD67649.1 carbamate kinase [Ignavibacteriales bacterium]HRR17978.1 carbamate kinase [Ignavibacteriales bacterium]